MYYEASEIKLIKDYQIEIKFKNGKKGIVDFSEYIDKGGVFKKLADMRFFKKVYINKEVGVLCWNDEIDIAPETLYSKATGEPLREWLEA